MQAKQVWVVPKLPSSKSAPQENLFSVCCSITLMLWLPISGTAMSERFQYYGNNDQKVITAECLSTNRVVHKDTSLDLVPIWCVCLHRGYEVISSFSATAKNDVVCAIISCACLTVETLTARHRTILMHAWLSDNSQPSVHTDREWLQLPPPAALTWLTPHHAPAPPNCESQIWVTLTVRQWRSQHCWHSAVLHVRPHCHRFPAQRPPLTVLLNQ